MLKVIRRFFDDVGSFLFSEYCTGCGGSFKGRERVLCTECVLLLPKTSSWEHRENTVYQRLYGRFSLFSASSFLYFTHSGYTQHLIHQFKYHNRQDLGIFLSHLFARHLLESGFFSSVDFIVPVPIHKRKEQQRGFNQSVVIAKALSKAAGIPCADRNLIKVKHTASQTKKSVIERIENTRKIFAVRDPAPWENKHLLLVDDVLTTGSTIEHCAEALLAVKGTRLSVATLAFAQT